MKAFGMTDKGMIRRDNQDHFRIEYPGEKTLLIVCDGMGGAKGGATASELACTSFLSNLTLALSKLAGEEDAVLMTEAVSYANLAVYEKSKTGDEYEGMGTTLVSAMVTGNCCTVVNVGDSRAYHFRGGACTQITRDHSLVEELVRQGLITKEEARHHPRKNVITQAVGLGYRLKSDTFTVELREGDRILLCSDGLSNLMEDDELAQIVFSYEEPEHICDMLIRMALERGAPDNVTAAVLRF